MTANPAAWFRDLLHRLGVSRRDHRRQVAAAEARALRDDPVDRAEIRAIQQDMAALHNDGAPGAGARQGPLAEVPFPAPATRTTSGLTAAGQAEATEKWLDSLDRAHPIFRGASHIRAIAAAAAALATAEENVRAAVAAALGTSKQAAHKP